MTANLIDEIEKYIPKSMALYDKELLLDNIKIILDEHKFTPPTSPAVKGVDELEAQLNQAQNNAEIWTAIWAIYDYLKQTSVAKEDVGEMGKHIMLQPGEYYKDEFGNIITYEDEQKERLKDYKLKEMKPIYDAKDPESNRKHIIENMC